MMLVRNLSRSASVLLVSALTSLAAALAFAILAL